MDSIANLLVNSSFDLTHNSHNYIADAEGRHHAVGDADGTSPNPIPVSKSGGDGTFFHTHPANRPPIFEAFSRDAERGFSSYM